MHVYFLTCVLIFWVPGIALAFGLWRGRSRWERRAFWITGVLVAVMSFGMEYVYLWADIWNFSEADDPLLGITIFGAPLEEFAYWFGATPFLLSVYWLMQRFEKRRGAARVSARRVRRA